VSSASIVAGESIARPVAPASSQSAGLKCFENRRRTRHSLDSRQESAVCVNNRKTENFDVTVTTATDHSPCVEVAYSVCLSIIGHVVGSTWEVYVVSIR